MTDADQAKTLSATIDKILRSATHIFLGFLFLCSIHVCAYADIGGVIKSASEYDYPPFSILNKDGKADGFSVELLRAALSALDLDVEFTTGPWEQIKEELSEGSIQVLPLVGRTPEREDIYDFTFPYLSLHGAVFVRKGDMRVKTVGDLADMTVVVMQGDNAEEFVRRHNISSHIIAVETYTEAMQLLDAGTYDAVIAQRLMGIQLLKNMEMKTVAPLDFVVHDFKQDFCFAVREGDKELLSLLNEGLSIVIANGTFDQLHEKWFGPLLDRPISFKDVIKYLLIVLIPFAAIAVLLSIFLLRREVKNKTNSLHQEIEERKRTEEALLENEEIFRSFMEYSPIFVFFKDENIRALRLSRNFETMLGKPIAELLGKNMDDLFPSELAKSMIADDMKIIKEGKAITVEEELNGLFYSTTKFPIFIKGKPRYLAGFTIDISERKKAEEQFKNIVNASPMGMHLYELGEDDRLVFIGANPASDKLLGVNHKEFMGKTIEEAFPGLVQTEVPARYRDAARNGTIWHAEQIDYNEGLIRGAFEVVAFQTGKNKMVVLFNEITKRKRAEEALRFSEERFRSIVSTSQEWIWSIDPAGRHTFSNPAIEKILGYTPDEIVGQDALHLLHEDDLPTVKQLLTRCIKQKTGWSNLDLRWKHRDGTWRYLESNAVPILDSSGVLSGFQGSDRDITERKQSEEEKGKLQAQLLQAQKMEAIGHLAGGVAHDFNNILSAIVGYSHIMLMKMKHDDPLRRNLEQILASSEKAANLTKSLLAFSRKQVIQMKTVNINNIVLGVTGILERIIGEDIYLLVNTAAHDLIVNVDTNQIEQVLMNLTTNARDTMPGGGTLTVTTEEIEIDEHYIQIHQEGEVGKYAVLSVTDTGTGMDEKTKENIFEPFFTTKEVGKGTGLGLAMVYGTIKQHNGFINVYSEPGIGTTFRIYLPLAESGEHFTETEEMTAIQSGTETILLVEDDEAVRNATKGLLEAFGYTVLEANDGKQAVHIYRENKDIIRLVITDVIMPGQSGKDLHNELKKITADIKILFISGYPSDILNKKGIIDNEVNFILKPFKPEILLNNVRKVLD